jgi:phenylalanyl-tRNA synthetase beta chain
MKISYNWIKELLLLNILPEETGALLTACGLEVENIETFESVKGGMKGLVIGEVLTCIKHPDADKLSLTTVNVGTGEILQIVCGAPNVAAGQKVVVALPGTKLFPIDGEPFIIKQSKIRGQLSNGMICAEDEIGLGISHAGVIVLPQDSVPGTPASLHFNIQNDHIFEIGLTPNRADAASHVGVARDLAAVIRTKNLIEKGSDIKLEVKMPQANLSLVGKNNSSKPGIIVEVENAIACPRYSGISISNVKVGESPAWLKNRLSSIGVNPINNIVDITNFVLHECGQPLHAFDADKIGGKKIVVRTARAGEKFITLDNVERKLFPEDLMICDVQRSMCIAGVYGGIDSGITENTTNVFIESAYFNPASIRKTSKNHGLKTDASFRFERGTDPEITIYALKRAAVLMCEIAGGTIASEVSDNYPVPVKHAEVQLDISYLENFSGERFDHAIIRTITEALGMKVLSEEKNSMRLEIPSFKVDVHRPADVVEEILRVYGYDRIPVPEKINSSLPSVVKFDREKIREKISNYLSSNGFLETITNSLTRSEYTTLPGWNESELVKILNPLSQDLSVLRQDMLATTLEAIVYNLNRRQNDIRFFEFGKTYFKTAGGYKERYTLCLAITGNKTEASWKLKDSKTDFYFLKAYVLNILSLCGIKDYSEVENPDGSFSSSMSISRNEDVLVRYGSIQKSILKKFNIGQEVFFADINWDLILKYAMKKPVHYTDISKFPAVKRDLSMLIGKEVSYAKLETIAYNAEKKLLRDIRLFDIYEGDKIEAGKKSYALSFILQDDQQTLTENQIGKVMDKLMAAFEREVGAVIRRN